MLGHGHPSACNSHFADCGFLYERSVPGPPTPDSPSGQYASFVAGTPASDASSASATAAPDTRAGYDSATGHAVWDAGDCLGVFVTESDYRNENLRFTQKAGTLSADRRTAEYEGTFNAPVSGNQRVYAVYPYDKSALISGTVIETTFPGRQVYTPNGYTGIPLFGKYEGDIAGLHFKGFMNPFAVIELRLASTEAVKVKRIVFQGNNEEPVAGSMEVEMGGARPAVTFSPYGTTKNIVLDCGEGVALDITPKSFYIAIPVQEYAKGYRFDIRTDREGANAVVLTARSGGVIPVANTIYGTPERLLAAGDFKYSIPDQGFRDYLVQKGFVTLNDETAGTVAILPATAHELDCAYREIGSLEGVEYFPQLTVLKCGYNNLKTLDVSKLTKLTTLDAYASRLTSLDVTANTLLTILNCGYNSLDELDLKANPLLTNLGCSGNNLSMLDTKANPSLTVLNCSSNQLTVLDVSANPLLTNLNCSYNQLTELDVSQHTSLTSLDCSGNQLAVLDIRANTLLSKLICYGNHLTMLDAAKMADPEDYHLLCGNQKDAGGGTVTLQLKLKEAQRACWEATLVTDSDNDAVAVTFEP